MARVSDVDVLLSLLGSDDATRLSGNAVAGRLAEVGRRTRPDVLLRKLLDLETAGLVSVQRSPAYSFALTPAGRDAAYAAGPGAPVEALLVMADLSGFTAFTETHGDRAAHLASQSFLTTADTELVAAGGRVVKGLGDGFLATLPVPADVVAVLRRIRSRLPARDGTPWALHAGAHHGRPIHHQGDLFGSDVNLVARLCEAAGPDEVLLSGVGGGDAREPVTLRGFEHPVPVHSASLS